MDTIPSGATGHELDFSLIQRYMSERAVGNARVYVQSVVTSTNDVVREYVHDLAHVDCVAVAADEQTSGRGRLDRNWESMHGLGIALSIAITAERIAGPLTSIPLRTGLAAVRALEVCGLEADLKWPNDIVLSGGVRGLRKLGGILVQRFPECIVMGIGINVAHSQEQLPIPEATSASLEGHIIEHELLIAHLMDEVRRVMLHDSDWLDDYRDRCVTIGTKVTVQRLSQNDITGMVSLVNDQGHLVLDVDGECVAIDTGDVQHVRVTD